VRGGPDLYSSCRCRKQTGPVSGWGGSRVCGWVGVVCVRLVVCERESVCVCVGGCV
jgi:hypothetical protein